MAEEFDKVPFPPPDISDLVKNEETFAEIRTRYKENKEIIEFLNLAVTLNAECRKRRTEMWSNSIYHNFYGDLMKKGLLVVRAENPPKEPKEKKVPTKKPSKKAD
jgi:hypothetical protein